MDKNICTPFFIQIEGRFNPFEITPPSGYIEPKNNETGELFPNCCTFHKQLMRNVENWFNKFPLCCDGHTKMAQKEKWFHKDQFNGLPMKIVRQVSYMEYYIKKVHKNPDWFEDITEYLDYSMQSFGSFRIGLDQYVHAVKYMLKDKKWNILQNKKQRVLNYITELETPKETIETDFNLLENIYRKWLKEFPFELEIFAHLKPKFEKTFPIVKEWGKRNRYTGDRVVILHTKSTMVEQLEDITIQIISEINSLTLHKKGELNDPLKYELSLLEEKRNLKLKTGYRNDVSTDTGYRKVLKEWFEDEKEWIREFKQLWPEIQKAQKVQMKKSKSGKNNFTQKEICMAYAAMKQQITVDNYRDILAKYSASESDKILQKRYHRGLHEIKITADKSADTKTLKSLERAKEIVKMEMNGDASGKKALREIEATIQRITKETEPFY